MANKHPLEGAADTPRPAKAAKKIQLSADLIERLEHVEIACIDRLITKESNSSAILTLEELKFAESAWQQRWVEPFDKHQIRVHEAQKQYSPIFATFYRANKKVATKVKGDISIKAAAFLLPFVNHEIVAARPSLQDAFLYRIWFLMSYTAFGQAQEKLVLKQWEKFWDEVQIAGTDLADDLTSYTEYLAKASERHLARQEERSVSWLGNGHTASLIVGTGSSGSTIQPNSDLVLEQTAHLSTKAASYVSTSEDLKAAGVIDWSLINSITPAQKQLLETVHDCRHLHCSEALRHLFVNLSGICLHGVQGSGKTELAKSWCAKINGDFISIDSSLEGKYRGESANLFRELVQQALTTAASKPVVVFFDEADQLFSKTIQDESRRNLQGLMKGRLTDLFNSKGEIYLICATNYPARIDWESFRRRFDETWHVAMPTEAGLQTMLKTLLAQRRVHFSDEQVQQVCEKLTGYGPHDIKKLIDLGLTRSITIMLKSQRWKQIDTEEGPRLTPAKKLESADIEGMGIKELGAERQAQCVPPPLTVQDFLASFGTQAMPLRKTYTDEELKMHEEWSRKNGTTGASVDVDGEYL